MRHELGIVTAFICSVFGRAEAQDEWDYNFGCTLDPGSLTHVSAMEVVPGELVGLVLGTEALIVAGNFNSVGNGLEAHDLAVWTGSEWRQLDPQFLGFFGETGNNRVTDMVFFEGYLYFAGLFESLKFSDVAGEFFLPADGLVRWDGSAWQEFTPGMPSQFLDPVVFAVHGNKLKVAGSFFDLDAMNGHVYTLTDVGGGQQAWSRLSGRSQPGLSVLESSGGVLLQGGDLFTTDPDPTFLMDAARLEGGLWVPLAPDPRIGPNFVVEDIVLYQGLWHFCGKGRGMPGPLPSGPIERLGTMLDWELLGSYENESITCFDMETRGSVLFVGGSASFQPPGMSVNRSLVQTWDGSSWSTPGGVVGDHENPNFDESVQVLTVWGEHIYAGGVISQVDGRRVTDITRFGPFCAADLTGSTVPTEQGRYGVPNGVLDADDFFYFLDIFSEMDLKADIDQDLDVDSKDYFAYLALFSAGC